MRRGASVLADGFGPGGHPLAGTARSDRGSNFGLDKAVTAVIRYVVLRTTPRFRRGFFFL
jgi:hypothetical protein